MSTKMKEKRYKFETNVNNRRNISHLIYHSDNKGGILDSYLEGEIMKRVN